MLGLNMQNNANLFPHQLDDRSQRKKIEDYSYGLYDKIGKGFSSIVYKGRNDITGNKHLIGLEYQPASFLFWSYSG